MIRDFNCEAQNWVGKKCLSDSSISSDYESLKYVDINAHDVETEIIRNKVEGKSLN